MQFSKYHLSKFREPRMVALSEGNGSGTKLYQALLDGHPQILMVPGYPLMYFYPFWDYFITPISNPNWQKICEKILICFAPIFDTRINPGSEDLNKLGKGQDQFIKVDFKSFEKIFIEVLEGLEINTRNCLLAIHYAYSIAIGQEVENKSILIYHIHVFDYVEKYLMKDFPNTKVIAAVRDPRNNLNRRELNSIIKPNKIKFRKTDEMLMSMRAYRQATKYIYNGLDSLDCVPKNNCRVYRHEDLALRVESVMKATAEFLEINFNESMLTATFGSKQWITSFYEFDTSKLVNPEIIKNDWLQIETKQDIFIIEALNTDYLNKYEYSYPTYYKDNVLSRLRLLFLIFYPSRIERQRRKEVISYSGFIQYFSALWNEMKNIDKLKSYEGNMFYALKWTNDGIDFSRKKIAEKILVNSLNWGKVGIIFGQAVYLLVGFIRYINVFIRIPWERILRIYYCIGVIIRRINGRRYLPDCL